MSKDMQWYDAKMKYERITPIRGKPHIKPLGERRKQHNTVELFDADKQIYSYKLYDTHVIKFYPDGCIGINIDSLHDHTQTTQNFVEKHVRRLGCLKFNNRLWINCKQGWFPMPDKGELVFKPVMLNDDAIGYIPAHKVMAKKKVVNRKRAKEIRAPYKEFIEFGKTLLAMSDGWVMPETIANVCGYEIYTDYRGINKVSFKSTHLIFRTLLDNFINQREYDQLHLYVYVTERLQPKEWRTVQFDTAQLEMYRYKPKQFADWIGSQIDLYFEQDIYDIIDVEATGSLLRSYV